MRAHLYAAALTVACLAAAWAGELADWTVALGLAPAIIPPGLVAYLPGNEWYASTRSEWGGPRSIGASIGRVDHVIVHTEAGASMSVGSTLAQERQRMLAIHRFHQSLGWSGFGYSAGVNPRSPLGRVHEGRGYRRSGAHTVGYNRRALAIVCFGHGDRNRASDGALDGIAGWVRNGIEHGHIAANPRVSGHRDHKPSKSCPGGLIYAQLDDIRARIAHGPQPEPTPDPEPRDPWEDYMPNDVIVDPDSGRVWIIMYSTMRRWRAPVGSEDHFKRLAASSQNRQFEGPYDNWDRDRLGMFPVDDKSN